MPLCSVRGCANKSGHLFPKNNPALKKKWLKFAGLTEKDINIYSLICKMHFAEDAFEQHEPIPGLPPPRKRLIPNAVPTLFPNLLHVQPMISPRKKPAKSAVYNAPESTTSCNIYSSNTVSPAEVGSSRSMVFSEDQLVRVIERIKEKLKNNAHPSAVFPRKWKKFSIHAGGLKIREGVPPLSMPCLVAMAIEANVKRMATPSQIVGFISQNFPGYKLADPRWHEKVFETLETYRLFHKVPSNISRNPKKTFYHFAPDRKTIMSPEVYEAFTDPFFDESKIGDLNNTADTSIAAGVLSEVASEDIEESPVDEFNDDFALDNSKDERVPVSAIVVRAKRKNEGSDSNKRVRFNTEDDESTNGGVEDDIESDSSADSSVTFLECRFCEFLATSSNTISTHVLQKHYNGKNYSCSQCHFETPSKENLVTHKFTHKKVKIH